MVINREFLDVVKSSAGSFTTCSDHAVVYSLCRSLIHGSVVVAGQCNDMPAAAGSLMTCQSQTLVYSPCRQGAYDGVRLAPFRTFGIQEISFT